jgi:hypothetical protein
MPELAPVTKAVAFSKVLDIKSPLDIAGDPNIRFKSASQSPFALFTGLARAQISEFLSWNDATVANPQ